MTLNDMVSIVVEYLTTLPDGTAISTSAALEKIFGYEFLGGGRERIGDKSVDTMEFFDIDKQVRAEAEKKGLFLDTSHGSDCPVGLPYNIPFHVSKISIYTTEYDRHLIFQKAGKHTMTWFHLTEVVYSKEYGDPTLPKLADMVSDTPDPQKKIILDYLREHCVAACPGIHHDVVNPKEVIGCGHIFTDDKYYWEDYLPNYIEKYNIPIPEEFRTHILENYTSRKTRHTKHRLLKSIRITNQPYLGYRYTVSIHQNGRVEYSNNLDGMSETAFTIPAEDADYIVHPITESMFCYDGESRGSPIIDGYHWVIEYFGEKECVYRSEGWPGEPEWRYQGARDLFEFIERKTGKDLGSKYMM